MATHSNKHNFKTFALQIPSAELAGTPALIRQLDELSGKPSLEGISETTQWEFVGLSAALKAVLIVHENSVDGNFFSHRLICEGYSYLEYGDFKETKYFK